MTEVGWPVNVNTKILDSTTISIGEGGFVEDSSSNGFKYRRATSLANPNKYQVTMDFDWLTKDANGLSEYDRFVRWFEYKHQYGANPFWFDSITRFSINGPVYDGSGNIVQCKYKISSALNCQKSGFSMRVTMTWEEVYVGIIEIQEDQLVLDRTEGKLGEITLVFSTKITTTLSPTSHYFYYAIAGTTNPDNFIALPSATRTRSKTEKSVTFYMDMSALVTGVPYTIIVDRQFRDSTKCTFIA